MSLGETRGTVFNIQTYCIHDGPGIRSTVFLKGCPLTCLWCQNPESNASAPQLMFYPDRCKRCGACATVCPQKAVAYRPGERPHTDRNRCSACGACTAVCPASCREIAGETRTASDVVAELSRDRLFFEGSGGGITVSGGEPLFQPGFTAAILTLAQESGLHTAVESSCFAARSAVDNVYAHANLALCDVKHMDSRRHRALTGVPNEPILDNIVHIYRNLHVPVVIRTPVVPGHNADDENILATARFVAEELHPEVPLHLLPYHRLGESKSQSLERENYELHIDPPADEEMRRLAALARDAGLQTVQIGG